MCTPLQLILDHVYNSGQTVDLSNAQIEDKEAAILAEILKVNETITNLNLKNNKITDIGASALLEACEVNNKIVVIDLDGKCSRFVKEKIKEQVVKNLDTQKNASSSADTSVAIKFLQENQVIEFNDDEIKDKVAIGSGSFGLVLKANWRGVTVAIKGLKYLLDLQNDGDKKLLEGFAHEGKLMATLHHLNIVKFYGTIESSPFFVMEFVEKGALSNLIRDRKTMHWDWTTRLIVAKDVTQGLKYLHEKNVIHRDMKSPNVLINKKLRAKISDFGISRIMDSTLTKGIGTLNWMAPEVICHQNYGLAADVYSLGMIFWELVEEKIPFAFYGERIIGLAYSEKKKKPLMINTHLPA